MRDFLIKMLITTLALVLSGCATVWGEDKQVVSVRVLCGQKSLPATCVAENSRGSWQFHAPRDVVVLKDVYALRVTCKSIMLEPHTVNAPASLQWTTALGNMLAGGAVVSEATGRGLPTPDKVLNASSATLSKVAGNSLLVGAAGTAIDIGSQARPGISRYRGDQVSVM